MRTDPLLGLPQVSETMQLVRDQAYAAGFAAGLAKERRRLEAWVDSARIALRAAERKLEAAIADQESADAALDYWGE